MNLHFYQVGGTLPINSSSYIKRDADDNLYNYLKEGKYCYVLNARQVGKSSLRVHTSKKLEEEGYRCVNIDLTSIGTESVTADEWYYSFIDIITEQLHLDENDFVEWWDSHDTLSVVSRFSSFFDKFILKKCSEDIIIFIDEVDSMLGINNFSTDDFFAVIRTFFNLRSEKEQYTRLTFVLFGVATPEDLMKDSSRTPFNIAHRVNIDQFTFEESLTLVHGLGSQSLDAKKILERVYKYTSGTPYLTQKILDNISQNPIKSLDDIEKVIGDLFIKKNFKEINFSNIQKRIIGNKKYNIGMINIIDKLIKGDLVKVDDGDLRHIYLQLSGLVKNEKNRFQFSNRIYKRVFSQFWLNDVLDKIDRPFAKDLHIWLELNKDSSALLKGKVLERAREWAENRNDLSYNEHQYLTSSNEVEHRERLNRENEKEKRTLHLRLIRFLVIAFFLVFISLGTTIKYYFDVKKQKDSAEEHRKIAEKQTAIAEEQRKIAESSAKRIDNLSLVLTMSTSETSDISRSVEDYLNVFKAYKMLISSKPYYYKQKMAEVLEKLGDLYHAQKNINDEKKVYTELAELYKVLIRISESKLNKEETNRYKKERDFFNEKIAVVFENLGDLDGINEIKRSKKYYIDGLEIYIKNPIKYQEKRAILNYKIANLLFYEKDFKLSKEYHDNGFTIYKDFFKKDMPIYIPKLAERFLWLAQWYEKQEKKKESYKYYIKAYNIYKNVKNKNISMKKINLIKTSLNKLNFNFIKKSKKNRQGWAYIGVFLDGKWKEQILGFDNTLPQNLKFSKQVTILPMNVRVKASPKAKSQRGIEIGTIISIKNIEIQHFRDKTKRGDVVWALVRYQ